MLFHIINVGVEEVMRRVKCGAVKLREKKMYTVAYADDMVLMAEEEEKMRSMMERFSEYVEEKKLELNTEKAKILKFRKEGETRDRRIWRWKEKLIEEVKEFKYLGYVLNQNGGQEAQIKNRVKIAAWVMGQVWGIA